MGEPEKLKNQPRPRDTSQRPRDETLEREEALVEANTQAVLHQQEILTELAAAKNAEARVRIFAKLMDTYGLDALVGLFEGAGDAAASALSGLYLLYEAEKANLSETDMVKIVALQAADFFIGSVPIVGDVADYFFKANKMSLSLFKKHAEVLIQEARASGVSEEAIAKLTEPADKLPRLVNHAVNIHQVLRRAA